MNGMDVLQDLMVSLKHEYWSTHADELAKLIAVYGQFVLGSCGMLSDKLQRVSYAKFQRLLKQVNPKSYTCLLVFIAYLFMRLCL